MSRVIQWVGIIVVLLSLGGAYYYYKTRAAQPVVVDDRPSFEAPLTTSIELARGQGSPTFTRADGADRRATVTDFEGIVRKVKAGEARFEGARRVENLLTHTEDFSNAVWIEDNGGSVATGYTDPNGGMAAALLTGTTTSSRTYQVTTMNAQSRNFVGSVWLKAGTASSVVLNVSMTTSPYEGSSATATLTSEWRRFSVSHTFANTTNGTNFIVRTSTVGTVYMAFPQLEEVTGQANQNPSEYVSVGVLSAPYHGAGVDGVKYFDTENGNTVASNVVTEGEGETLEGLAYGSLPGTSGSYFSTPDADKLDITGDIDIRVKVAMEDWTPSEIKTLVTKFPVATSNRSYALTISTAGELRGVWSTNGSSGIVVVSSITTGFTNGTTHWVRVTRAAATGVNTFYTSEDGETWTQLGDPVSGTSGSLASTGSLLAIGGSTTGTENLVSGKIHRAQVFNGIDGTIAADFDPSEWSSGDTWTSRTGEAWTRNGGASLWKNSLKGYLAEGSRTNLFLRSEEFDNTAWTTNALNATVTANTATAPDGTLTAEKFAATTTNGQHYIRQSFNSSAATYAYSAYLKNAGQRYAVFSYGTLNSCFFVVDLQSGTIPASGGTAGSGVTCVSGGHAITNAGNGWYRVSLVVTDTGVTGRTPAISLHNSSSLPSDGGGGTFAGDGTSGIYVWGAQLEQAAFASSYILTTSASVTRAEDSLSYPTENNIAAARGSASMDVYMPTVTAPSGRRAFDATGNNNTRLQLSVVEATTDRTTYFTGTGSGTQNVSIAAITGAQKLAITWDPTAKGSLFRNGTKIGTLSAAPSITLDTTLYLGRVSGGTALPLYGNVKNVKIWQKALSDDDLEDMTVGMAGVTQATTNKRPSNDGLIGYWSFEEGRSSTLGDSSGNGLTGTLTSMDASTDWVTGKAGTALDFDGTNDRVILPTDDLLDLDNDPFTIVAWSKGSGAIISRGGGPGATTGGWSLAPGSFGTKESSGGNAYVRAASVAPGTTEWIMTAVAGSYSTASASASSVNFYTNGELNNGTETKSFATAASASSTPAIGARSYAPSGVETFYGYFNGQIDEVRIYNRVLSPEEIADLYRTTGSSVKLSVNHNDKMTDNLVGYWNFNGPQVSGTTVTDLGSGGNNGTISGATVAPGKIGQALSLDGTDDVIEVVAAPLGSAPSGNYALSAWIKLAQLPSNQAYFISHSQNRNSGTSNASLIVNSSGQVLYSTRPPSFGSVRSVTSTTTLVLGEWYHVTGVTSGGTMRLYINGTSEGTPTAEASMSGHSRLFIGAEGNCGGSECTLLQLFFPGLIDEVRVYSDALTADEVEELYNLGR